VYSSYSEDCLFVLEGYNSHTLTNSAILKIRHFKIGGYLSLDKDGISLSKDFRLVDTFQLKMVDYSKVRVTAAINLMYSALSEIYSDSNLLIQKDQLREVTNELIYLIFKSSFSYS
jgi:hypothetical protein